MALLTKGNRELAADGIYTWTIPALGARLSNGKTMITCPNAGVCAHLCYARNGTYMFSNVAAAHVRNLEITLNLSDFIDRMTKELSGKKFAKTGTLARYADLLSIDVLSTWQREWLLSGGKAVRIHDSGDFYSDDYFKAWLVIAEAVKDVFFYAYTKEVAMIKKHGQLPDNMVIIYSFGGKQDYLIDRDTDRHSEVFPTFEMMHDAGYTDNSQSDILAALMPSNKVGLIVNNIPHLKKKQGSNTFGELQFIKSL